MSRPKWSGWNQWILYLGKGWYKNWLWFFYWLVFGNSDCFTRPLLTFLTHRWWWGGARGPTFASEGRLTQSSTPFHAVWLSGIARARLAESAPVWRLGGDFLESEEGEEGGSDGPTLLPRPFGGRKSHGPATYSMYVQKVPICMNPNQESERIIYRRRVLVVLLWPVSVSKRNITTNTISNHARYYQSILDLIEWEE